MTSFDAVVVGAGIVGTACALELTRAHLKVAVVEPNEIGGGATAAGMGHLAVMDDSPAQFALTSYSQALWKALRPELPADVEYLACGALSVAADDFEMAEVQRKFEFYRQRAIAVEVLDRQSLAQAEPNLRPGLAGALLMQDDAVIYPPCAALFLLEQAQTAGAVVFLGKTASEIGPQLVTLTDGTRLNTGATILANGTAATRFVPELNLKPRKGHLLITDRYPGFLHHQLIELGYLKSAHSFETDSVAFNAQPRQTGQLLLGSSRQFGTENSAVEQQMLSAMLRRALEYMPKLSELLAIRTWTGFRAATPDKLPLVGPWPKIPSLFLATGHEGLGISTSLATAKLIGDTLLGRASAIPREPYLPDRNLAPATKPEA